MDTTLGIVETAQHYASDAAVKVRKTGRVAILDLDGTCTGESDAKKRLRALAQEKEYAEVFGSARTFELMVSEDSRQLTANENFGFSRPRPLCGFDQSGRRIYQQLETVPLFQHHLNPDAVISFGVGNFLRLKGGVYRRDEHYDAALGGRYWREITMSFLRMQVDPEEVLFPWMVPLDDEKNYDLGAVDVAPLPYRIGFEFRGPEGFERKLALKRKVMELYSRGRLLHEGKVVPGSYIAAGLAVVDESHPEIERYTSYVLPRNGTKEKAYNRFISQLLKISGRRNDQVELLIAGDTMTDFRAGCCVGWTREQLAIKGTFLLAGGSRLSEYLVGKRKGEPFAGESLKWALDRFEEAGKGNQRGVYYFKAPWSGPEFRRVIIADEAFPGTKEAESLLAYFESDLCMW